MKIATKFLMLLFLLIFAGFIWLIYTPGQNLKFNPGPEFEHTGFAKIKIGQYTRYRNYIPLSDSTKIAVTYFIPKNGKSKKLPAILMYSPYTSSIVVPEMSLYKRILSKYYTGSWGPVYDRVDRKYLNTLTSNGYVVVLADMRGTGSSTGHKGFYDPIIIQDAEEILFWIANQKWSNASIGMSGQSYLGWSQLAAATTNSPYLKCIAPEMIFFNMYTEGLRPGGIFAQQWINEYSKSTLELNNRNLWNTLSHIPSYPSEPVIDVDGDGNLYDEIPMIKVNDMNPYSGRITYDDGQERIENPYITMTKEHEKNISLRTLITKVNYIDDSCDYFGREFKFSKVSTDFLINKLRKSNIPMLLSGGFFDGLTGMPQIFANLHKTNPVYLFMAPRFHIPAEIADQYKSLFDYSYSYYDQLLSLRLQFFDKYLKNIDNGFDGHLPVRVYTAFEGWKYYDTWPPKEVHAEKYFIGEKLTKTVPQDSIYTYNVDFTHSSSYNFKKTNPQLLYIYNDSLMIRNEHDEKCLVFETEPLSKDIIVTGYPVINLYVSSNQPDADIYVYLSDVDTTGTVYYVVEGKLRVGWHRLFDNDESVNYLYDVIPELPWHSYKKVNYDFNPLKDNSIVELKFSLNPHAWKFQKGHKIRLSIAGADNKNYEFNPAVCPENKIEYCQPTTLFIHTGSIHQSFLELPVLN